MDYDRVYTEHGIFVGYAVGDGKGKYNKDRGRCVYAGRNFKRGEIVLLDGPDSFVIGKQHQRLRCNHCFKRPTRQTKGLMVCTGCKNQWYDSKECQLKAWKSYHKYECRGREKSLPNNLGPDHVYEEIALIKRVLYLTIMNGGLGLEVGGEGNEYISEYTCSDGQTFGRIETSPTKDQAAGKEGSGRIFRSIWRMPPNSLDVVKKMEDTHDYEQSLSISDLVLASVNAKVLEQLFFRLNRDTIMLLIYKMKVNNFSVWDELLYPVGSAVYSVGALVNHSCDANCVLYYDVDSGSKRQYFRAIRDIKEGDEITHCYLDVATPTPQRREKLLQRYGFECTCDRCICPTLADRHYDARIKEKEGILETENQARLFYTAKQSIENETGVFLKTYEVFSKYLHVYNIERLKSGTSLFYSLLEENDAKNTSKCIEVGLHVLHVYESIYVNAHPIVALHCQTLGEVAGMSERQEHRDLHRQLLLRALDIFKICYNSDSKLVQMLKTQIYGL